MSTPKTLRELCEVATNKESQPVERTTARVEIALRMDAETMLRVYEALKRSSHALETSNERAQRRFLVHEAIQLLDGETNKGTTI